MSLTTYNKMRMYALEHQNIEVINFNYIIIKFGKSKEATAFKDKFEKQVKAYNRDMSTDIQIKRFPENKRDQPILRIEGLGDLAVSNFNHFTAILTLIDQFSKQEQPTSTSPTNNIVTGADLARQEIESHGNLNDPNDWIVAYFNGKKHIIKKNELINNMQNQFPDIDVPTFIEKWWDSNRGKYGSFDPDLGIYLLTE